jgi:riboflavin synthase
MFTGIIEEVGIIQTIIFGNNCLKLTIKSKYIIKDIKIGCSISVNGVCLTVISFNEHEFVVDVMPETYRTTSLSGLKINSDVNLERALAFGARLDGHLVSGHVDTTGKIVAIKKESNAIYIKILFLDVNFLNECVYHGSIAIDGTSLTIFAIDDCGITISLVPHTKENSIIGLKKIGDIVNIECDMIAKYVKKLLLNNQNKNNSNNTLNYKILVENGFV